MADTELTNSKIDNRPVDSDEAYLRVQARVVEKSESEADPFLGTFEEERIARAKITKKPTK